MGGLLTNCTKESNVEKSPQLSLYPESQINNSATENWRKNVTATDGMLIFTDQLSADLANDFLTNANFEELTLFKNEFNITTQQYVLENVMLTEERVTDAFYAPYSKLSDEEIYALNLNEPRSEPYKDALSKDLLLVEEDSKYGHTYYLNLMDPTVSPIINENGFVQIGDKLYQYKSHQIKFCEPCDLTDLKTLNDATITDEAIGLYTFTKRSGDSSSKMTLVNDWSGLQNKTFEPTGVSNRRARWSYTGFSQTGDDCTGCLMLSTFFIHVEAQRKRWGKWKYRNSYKPRFQFDGDWSGKAEYSYNNCDFFSIGHAYLDDFNLPTGVTNTPMVNRWFIGNNSTGIKLHNHTNGAWWPPANNFSPGDGTKKCWERPTDVYSININGKLTDGCSGANCDLEND